MATIIHTQDKLCEQGGYTVKSGWLCGQCTDLHNKNYTDIRKNSFFTMKLLG